MPDRRMFSLKPRILIPFTLSLLFLAIVFGISVFLIQDYTINREAEKQLQETETLFYAQIENDTGMLQAALETLKRNKNIEDAFKNKNRQALLAESLPLFKILNKNHKITHFYYTGKDRINILRVHKPDEFGDKIKRFTTRQAEQTGSITSGIELGPLGTFTLRVVAPWYDNGQLIGYVEMGEEISHIIKKVAKILSVDVYVLIEKEYLDQTQWTTGMQMLGRDVKWNQFPTVVLIDKSADRLPTVFDRYLDESAHESLKTDIRTEFKGRRIQGRFIHLKEANGRSVGDMVVTFDITGKIQNLHRSVYIFMISCLGIGLFLFILFFRIADKTENSFDTIHTRIVELEKDRSGFILGHLPAHISILNDAGCFMQWNQSAERIFGYAPSEAIGTLKLKDLLDDPAKVHEIEAIAMENGFAEREVKGKKIDDGFLWLNIRLIRMPGASDRPEMLCVVEDITRRTLAQQAGAESENQFRSLIESSPIGIFIARDGRFSYVNPAFMTMQDVVSDENLINQSVDKIFVRGTSDLSGKLNEDEELMLRGVKNFEATMLKHNCERVETAVWLTHMEEQGTLALLAFVIDISVEKKLRSQLIQSQKMESIGTLAGGIAHDFNNILSSIIGYTELSMVLAEKESELEEFLNEILTAGNRAKDLVKQILTFARQAENELKPVQVSRIAKEVLKLMRSALPVTIEIQQDIASDSLVNADLSQIHQIFMNLCTNAVHAMEGSGGGVLEVRLKDTFVKKELATKIGNLQPGDHLEISVQDSGVGMTPEIMKSIFEPYFTTKEPGRGTGMGLSVIHGIVRNYNGEITVSSEPGEGSLFTVYLPVLGEAIETKKLSNIRKELPTGKEHILVVDDEPSISLVTGGYLEQLGYTVTKRTSSIEALELFRVKPDIFDLAITDMTMPHMTGDILAAELMGIRSDIPVILCTGYSKTITRERAEAIGIRAFLMKPLDREQIAEAVRRVLDEKI